MVHYAIPVLLGILQLATYFVIGFFLKRRNLFSSQFFTQLSRLVIRVALPFYYFVRLSSVDISSLEGTLFFPLLSLILTTAGFAISYGVMRLMRIRGREMRVGMVLGTFGNSGFIPLFMVEMFPLSVPMIADLFGMEIPLLYLGAFALIQSPLVFTVGNFLLTGNLDKPKLSDFFSPPIIGILVGLAGAFLHIETYTQDRLLPFFHIFSAFEQFGRICFPLIIICLGAIVGDLGKISFRSRKSLYLLAFSTAGIRLLLLPLLFILSYFTILQPLNLSPAHIWVTFLLMHIPPGTIFTMMAAQAGINSEETSFTVMINYILYIFLLPVYIIILLSLPGII